MKYSRSFISKLLFTCISFFLFLWPSSLLGAVAAILAYIPHLVQAAAKGLIALGLVAGYYVNIKPHFSSQAEPHIASIIKNDEIQPLLQKISDTTGLKISPEFLSELNKAGLHHDYEQIATLLAHIQTKDGSNFNLIDDITRKKIPDADPHSLVPGIQAFATEKKYLDTAEPVNPPKTFQAPATSVITIDLSPYITPARAENEIAFIPEKLSYQNSESLIGKTCTVPFANVNQRNAFPSQLHQQDIAQSFAKQAASFAMELQQKNYAEFSKAMNSIVPHLKNIQMRMLLHVYVNKYKKTLQHACQTGAHPETVKAQFTLATQGLPLPGFLNEFSECLKEKTALLCFDKSGIWKGLENSDDAEKMREAISSYQEMIDTLSTHLETGKTAQAQECAAHLYSLDQGYPGLWERTWDWIYYRFADEKPSYNQMRSHILSNSYNKNVLTTIDLLQENKFELARTPLETINKLKSSKNRALLNSQLFKEYKDGINSKYDSYNIPLFYQDDPVYWLYKPDMAELQPGDPRLVLVEGHLAIRDSIYHSLIAQISKGKPVPELVKQIAYDLVGKLQDPLAVIDRLKNLNANDPDPAIRQACSFFYDHGVLAIFDLKEKLSQYQINLPHSIDDQEHTELRTAVNQLLLIDTQTELGKRSIVNALSYVPYACNDDEYSYDYANLIFAITQAHIQPKAPTGILTIKAIPHPALDADSKSNLYKTLLHAAGEAALKDLHPIKNDENNKSPLTVQEAWEYISQVQEYALQDRILEAQALSDTYLQGFIDQKMPGNKFIISAIVGTAVGASTGAGTTWFAMNSQNQKQSPKLLPTRSNPTPSPDDEDKDKKKPNGPKDLCNLTKEELEAIAKNVELSKPELKRMGFTPEKLQNYLRRLSRVEGIRRVYKRLQRAFGAIDQGAEINSTGAWHELETAVDELEKGNEVQALNKEIEHNGEVIEIDVITNKEFIESKNVKFENMHPNTAENLKTQLEKIKDAAQIAQRQSRLSSARKITNSDIKQFLADNRINLTERKYGL